MEDILFGLNDQQRAAVTCPSNVLQVLAPPGSGKTKTLTARVAYHIAHEGLRPWNIIVCTFTIKAAREMKERIKNFVGHKLESQLVLGTFHSIARRYLSSYGHHVGVPKHFGIADSNDSLAIIKRIVKKGNYSMEPGRARSRISKRKSGVAKSKSASTKLDVEQQEFEAIFAAYDAELEIAKLLDYDDLLLKCVELLKRCPECVSNIEAVLIDEFQDTNHVQYELMNLFAQHRTRRSDGRIPKITIVGDPDQSIYSFRSAEIANLKRMQDRYHDTIVIHLEENYRSSGSILQFAIEVIEQDTARPPKKLQATHSIGPPAVLRTLGNASIEASWIVSEIRRSLHLNAGLLTYADYAVLLRSASLSRLIETEMGRAGIPYRMVGGHKFFDRVEVRILLDYLRVISQPDHNDALLRIINVPSRKLGDTTIQTLIRERDARQKPLWAIVKSIAQGTLKPATKLSQQAMTGLETFTSVILGGQQRLGQADMTVGSMLAYVMQKLKYESFLKDTYKQEYEDRAANVDELVTLANSGKVFVEQEEELIHIDGIAQQESKMSGSEEVLAQFLAKIALATDADKQDADPTNNDKVVISTIHAAKGLEWPVVFIPATYQGSIPHSRAEDIDEERRLLYVGMTRAKALLYLSWPKMSSRTEHTIQSPFLTTPTISRYYDCRGPVFGWQVSKELAHILRRDCPTSNAINERYLAIGSGEAAGIRTEDNFHAEDENEEINAYGSLFGLTHTAEGLDQSYGGATKRRKYQHSTSDLAEMSSNAGFTSARQQMHVIPPHSERQPPAISRSHSSLSTDKPAKSVSAPKKAAAGQKPISTFFSVQTQTKATQSPRGPGEPALSTSSNHNIGKISGFEVEDSTRRGKVSQSLPGTTRQVHNQPSFHRPKVLDDEGIGKHPTHVLLSSSPTRLVHDHAQKIGNKHHNSVEEEEKENSQERGDSSDVKSARTFTTTTMHTTSMQRLSGLQSRPGVRKKVVGRATGGWVNTQFKPPSFR